MSLVTLTNDFHNTTARVRAGKLSRQTVRRVRGELCGMDDCQCSGPLGHRGRQAAAVVLLDYRDGQEVYEVQPKG